MNAIIFCDEKVVFVLKIDTLLMFFDFIPDTFLIVIVSFTPILGGSCLTFPNKTVSLSR